MKLTILATSDMHGYIYPTNFGSTNQNQPFGAAKAATVIERIQQETKNPVITIENGDFIQGSPLSFFLAKQLENFKPSELMNVLNLIQYDVGLLGNHEFNYGLDYLKMMEDACNHPIVCANILGQDGKPFYGKAYEIIEKQGVKIAILGLTTQFIPHWEHPDHIKGLTFRSIVDTAKEYIPLLREQADVVIVSYHGGFERDLETGAPTERLTGENEGYQLLHEVSGIDALVTGHQHRTLAQKVNGIPIIQPGFRGEFVGQITLNLKQVKQGWTITTSEAELIPTGNEVVAPRVAQAIRHVAAAVEKWLDQPLGRVNGSMKIKDPDQARIREHPYIEFIQKVQMDACGVDISGTALFNNEGKGFNEIITMRDVVTNYVYPNTLAVLRVSGADLKAALERCASFFKLEEDGKTLGINSLFINPKPQYYNYDMYEGIEYTLDISKPIGERVTKLEYHKNNVQSEDTLEIVMNQYRAVGGGDYLMFSADKIIREVQIDMTELIANYLQRHPVIDATVNHNFSVISIPRKE